MLKKGRLQGLGMFLIACFISPCCTPLIVPLIIALLAGTPVALWMSQNLGWVYGALSIVSLASFVLALRWMGKRKVLQPLTDRLSNMSVTSPLEGDNVYVE